MGSDGFGERGSDVGASDPRHVPGPDAAQKGGSVVSQLLLGVLAGDAAAAAYCCWGWAGAAGAVNPPPFGRSISTWWALNGLPNRSLVFFSYCDVTPRTSRFSR